MEEFYLDKVLTDIKNKGQEHNELDSNYTIIFLVAAVSNHYKKEMNDETIDVVDCITIVPDKHDSYMKITWHNSKYLNALCVNSCFQVEKPLIQVNKFIVTKLSIVSKLKFKKFTIASEIVQKYIKMLEPTKSSPVKSLKTGEQDVILSGSIAKLSILIL